MPTWPTKRQRQAEELRVAEVRLEAAQKAAEVASATADSWEDIGKRVDELRTKSEALSALSHEVMDTYGEIVDNYEEFVDETNTRIRRLTLGGWLLYASGWLLGVGAMLIVNDHLGLGLAFEGVAYALFLVVIFGLLRTRKRGTTFWKDNLATLRENVLVITVSVLVPLAIAAALRWW